MQDYVARPDRISGADINAIVQEAGMQAVRENRYIVLPKDFEKGYKNNIKKDETEHEFYKWSGNVKKIYLILFHVKFSSNYSNW